ncbi:MAG: hypothetical protein DHS20C08_07270 [Rhodomicrobium sp.]|nr:MAG: hypothetical protein DHS20C08_07270 [Rhodomicrobium sp.]
MSNIALSNTQSFTHKIVSKQTDLTSTRSKLVVKVVCNSVSDAPKHGRQKKIFAY